MQTLNRIRVVETFRAPRRTTNPYIVMLDEALSETDGLDYHRFSWPRAILGRYDVLHIHWPETRLQGSTRVKRALNLWLFELLLVRLRLIPTAVVRTVHNLELPSDLTMHQRSALTKLDTLTSMRITLNPVTPTRNVPNCFIPHGHYRDWFRGFARAAPTTNKLGYFGLMRRYKGMDALLSAYAEARDLDDSVSLDVGGLPSSADISATVERAQATIPGIKSTLRFLEDSEIVRLATGSQLIVLPYVTMHNSGGALAALSLDRPVLVPETEATISLRDEVGEGWVICFSPPLTGATLLNALDASRELTGKPDLSRRDWSDVGVRHRDAFLEAMVERRGSGRRWRRWGRRG
ncbi:glycosyl transferase [Glaciibacter flavus]|uniref:Glycosyl transferase n=1 Tax=Orlajensenia flava TaxID=2565934 RepID=A0A4S4FKY5_9MICO|nr:glycosyl transferase [Glaciibacter flavus]THG30552.1 glycosyl transferase [Glaciibacter flavus]